MKEAIKYSVLSEHIGIPLVWLDHMILYIYTLTRCGFLAARAMLACQQIGFFGVFYMVFSHIMHCISNIVHEWPSKIQLDCRWERWWYNYGSQTSSQKVSSSNLTKWQWSWSQILHPLPNFITHVNTLSTKSWYIYDHTGVLFTTRKELESCDIIRATDHIRANLWDSGNNTIPCTKWSKYHEAMTWKLFPN